MPIHQVETPDGQIIKVEAPEGATDDQILAFAQSNWSPAKPESGDLVRGFKSYIPQTKETFGGAQTILGLGAEKLLGKDSSVAKYLTEHGMQNIKEAKEAQKPLQKESDSFTSAWEKGIGSVITDWLPYQIGQGAANILETGATAIGGAAIGSVIPGVGTSVGALEGIVGKSLIKKGVKEMAEKILAEKGEDAAQAYIAKEAKKQIGLNVGLMGQAGMHGVGEVGSRAIEEAEARGQDIHELNLSEIFPAAAVHAAADFVSNKIGLGAIDGLSKPTQNMLMNVGKSVLFTGAKEVPPELLQSAAERYGAQLPLSDKNAIDEYINTAAASFGMSVVPGTIGGVRTRSQQPTAEAAPNTPPVAQPEEAVAPADPNVLAEQERIDAVQAEIARRRAEVGAPPTDTLEQRLAGYEAPPEQLSPLEKAAAESDRRQAAAASATQLQVPPEEAYAAVEAAARSVEQAGGVATPAQAQLLDQYFPNQRLYDRIEGAETAAPSPIIMPEGRAPRETVRFGEQPSESTDAWEKLTADRQQREAALPTEVQAESPVRPEPQEVLEAINTPAFQQTPEQRLTLQAAEKTYTPEELQLIQTPAFMQTAEQKVQLRGIQRNLDKVVQEANQGNEQAKMQLREAGAEFAPEVQQSAEAIRSELTPFLDKIGLGNVGLQLVNSINNGTADGAYFRNVIQIALDAKNPLATLRHESIHALNQLNAFSPQEWSYLNNQAKEKWVNEFIPAEKQAQYKDQYVKDNGSEEGFDAYLQEEAIAEAFRAFGDKPKAGILKRIVNKLKAFFDATGNWFRGNGFNSIDSIFSGVEAGRYAPSRAAEQMAAQPAYDLRSTVTDAFKKWFGKSKIVDADGNPKVLYHGTGEDFNEFSASDNGSMGEGIYFTDDPASASRFAERKPDNRNVMPVYVKAEKILDIDNMTNDQVKNIKEALPRNVEDLISLGYPKNFANELWDLIETDLNKIKQSPNFSPKALSMAVQGGPTKVIQGIYKRAGYDALTRVSTGLRDMPSFREYLVFEPNQIKSVFNKAPTESKDIRYSLTNAPPDAKTTKTEKVKSFTQTTTEAVNAVMTPSTRSTALTKLRNRLFDTSAALSNRLAQGGLGRFVDGKLRADLINHAKMQVINLMRNMSKIGLPMLNADGTVGIERSEKTLAKAQEIADALDANPEVRASGLSGRDFVAKVAYAKRAEEIQKDDARRNAKGRQMLVEAKEKAAQAKKLAGGNPKEYHALMAQAEKLQKAGNKEAAKELRREARNVSRGNLTAYRALMKEIRDLRREGYQEKNLKREYRSTPELLAWANKQIENVPELNQIFDIWRTNNHAAIDLQQAVGLISKQTADEYKRHEHYIPLFKSSEDLDAEKVFGGRGGQGAKSIGKRYELEGGTHEVNVWENVHKQMARMVSTAYENQARRIAAEQLIGVGAAKEVSKSNPHANLVFKRDGKDVAMIVEDELIVDAFKSMPQAVNPVLKMMGKLTTGFRYGALLNPMFWVKQLLRDSFHSTMVTEQETTPFHSMKNFADIILKRETDAYRTLVEHGVIGEVGSTLSLDDYIKSVGKSEATKQSYGNKLFHKLLQVHESSDAATRVGIYKSAFKKAKADGMSDVDAKNYAVMATRESINFAVQGNSELLAGLRPLIPFLSASLASLDTVYKAASGYGLNAEEKKQVQKVFIRKAAIFTTFVVAYAMMLQDDDDYKSIPDNIRDNNFLLPVPSPTDPTKRVFVKIPIPFEIGFLLKTIPEAAIRYLSGNSTGDEFGASVLHGFQKTLPGEGNPMPQVLKPIYENYTNYSFFTGKPIVSQGEQRLPVEARGAGSSEFSKQVGGAMGVSPQMIDNLISGYMAELGTSSAAIASSLISKATGVEPPATNFESQWFIKSFVTNPNVNKAISDFYNIDNEAQQTVNHFNELKKTGDVQAIEKFVQNEDNIIKMSAQKALSKIGDTMGKLRAQIRFIEKNQDMSPEERRQIINELQKQQAEIAAIGVDIAKQMGAR